MAETGSALPGGYVLGAMSHADRIGLIYEARAADGGRTASALVLHPLHVEELRAWFEDNAALGMALRHPNLVEVLAAGETHNGLPVMVTARVEGRTLRARIAAGDLVVGGELLRVLRGVSSALDYLHGCAPPVLHRALMPEHVLCTVDGGVKLLAVGHADRPQHAPAKPAYLSPEEILGAPTSPASDVFSLASLTFELLTGRVAFAGPAANLVAAVQRGALPWVGVGPSDGLAPLGRVLHRAWSFDPRARPPRAGVFAAELEEALRAVPQSMLTVRRALRESTPARGTPSVAPRGLTPSQHPSQFPGAGRPSARPQLAAVAAARVLTPFPSSAPPPQRVSPVYALPPPSRVPTSLAALVAEANAEPAEIPIDLVHERRSVSSTQVRAAPAPEPVNDSVPARLRVDTDDAVLILEPALVDADHVTDGLVEGLPPDDDEGPEIEIFDEPPRVQVVQKRVVVDATRSSPPALDLESPVFPPSPPLPKIEGASALALTSAAPPGDPRPSWSHWRPALSARMSSRPWHAREMRFTPRLVALIVVGNLALTLFVVWLTILLTRR
jgi:hypothetical protein